MPSQVDPKMSLRDQSRWNGKSQKLVNCIAGKEAGGLKTVYNRTYLNRGKPVGHIERKRSTLFDSANT
jgi:hypothetical protein